jgi:hypothetical protein
MQYFYVRLAILYELLVKNYLVQSDIRSRYTVHGGCGVVMYQTGRFSIHSSIHFLTVSPLYMAMKVYVCVSTKDTPSMDFNLAKKASSGA